MVLNVNCTCFATKNTSCSYLYVRFIDGVKLTNKAKCIVTSQQTHSIKDKQELKFQPGANTT